MSSLTDSVEQLDRLHDFFATTRRDEDVFAELHRFVECLQADTRLGSIFNELVLECMARFERMRAADEMAAGELLRLRQEVTAVFDELNDEPDPEGHPLKGRYSLARFDEMAAQPSSMKFSRLARDMDDDSLTAAMTQILRSRMENRFGHERLYGGEEESIEGSFMRRLRNVEMGFTHARKDWLLYDRTHGASSALRLLGVAAFLNPVPEELGTDLLGFVNKAWAEMSNPYAELRDKTFGESTRRAFAMTPDTEAKLIEDLRTEGRRAYEEIRRRLLSRRSHRALVLRFAQWVQLYERDEMYDLAQANPGKVEDELTKQLARFLFEAGLNPLTNANVGTTKPDLLDPTTRWTFYVEAKQYQERPAHAVKKAVAQIADTLLRLRALPNGVREAFLVVFRVGGRLVEMPEELVYEGVRIWPILVDIAPPTETGSRQKHSPAVLTSEELLPPARQGEGQDEAE